MKCKIPEISWHNRDPVLSVDIQAKVTDDSSSSNGSFYRLASGGTDAHVLIWHLELTADGSDIELDLLADLTRHQRAVNAVKWSPNGEMLASGDDESVVFIWKQKAENEPLNILETTSEQDKETWIVLKVLRGHMEDIYDLSWAPNSQFLVSGSVDNSAMIWDVQKGKSLGILSDHKGFVQGVAWDPKNQYIATLSTDRYLRIFDIQSKRVLHRVNKSSLPVPEGHGLHGQRVRLFHDDTLQTFFRRLTFTPDGKLLLTPAGVAESEGETTHPLHTTYAFSRHAFRQPAIVLPCSDQYTVAVSCCPLLFCLRPHNVDVNPPVVPLPYRMIFAVATRSSVYFYDTQQRQPFALISNIHYTRLTDVTWSHDGRIVVVSSTDGFCSLITFEKGELGEEYPEARAVLESALNTEAPVNVRKTKKQKENVENAQEPARGKSATDETEAKTGSCPIRKPLLEKVNEEEAKKDQEKDEVVEMEVDDVEANKDKDSKKPAPNVETSLVVSSNTLPVKASPVEIIIEKEILSSECKFDSPEKKSLPATPITVRRTPRSAIVTATAISTPPSEAIKTPSHVDNSPLSSVNSPRQTKRATPIAIRRTPRVLIPAAQTPTAANVATVVEEAMDAWPLENIETEKKTFTANSASTTEVLPSKEISLGCTEDIRLVYEDSTNETMEKPNNEILPSIPTISKTVSDQNQLAINKNADEKMETSTQSQRTPNASRRVPLKTISTPKSKKKLLE